MSLFVLIKGYLKDTYFANRVYCYLRKLQRKDILSRKAKVINKGVGKYTKDICGSNNLISIGAKCKLSNPVFHIYGNNNVITVHDGCTIGKGCSFWMEGNNIRISIGENSTFVQFIHFNAQEDGTKIDVGEDCMFSNHIIVRTSDSHPIYDIESQERINSAKDVVIGNHVWIAPDSKIMKGALIGPGCVIGSNSIVTKEIPAHTLAVGAPAKVVKQSIRWTREGIIFHE